MRDSALGGYKWLLVELLHKNSFLKRSSIWKSNPCPKACQFDWATFEILFDMAIAHMVEEKHCYAHKTSLADLMEYVLAKQQANERREIEEIT
jgi:hypothetical protein